MSADSILAPIAGYQKVRNFAVAIVDRDIRRSWVCHRIWGCDCDRDVDPAVADSALGIGQTRLGSDRFHHFKLLEL
jgi:hypothetical protein